MSDPQYIKISWDGELAIVAIDRQEKLNALNAEVITELGDALDSLRFDDQVRGVILTGAGEKAFVAGADIGELAKMDALSGVQVSRRGQGVFRSIEGFPSPYWLPWADMPWAVGASWPWPVTSGSQVRTPGSGFRKSVSASSRGTEGPSGWPVSSASAEPWSSSLPER